MAFSKLPTTQRGNVGEKIAFQMLIKKGWQIMGNYQSGPHLVDAVGIRETEFGFDVVAIEVKTYPRCHSYDRTGIDVKDFHTYKRLARAIPLTILFVDPFEGAIYAIAFRDHLDAATFDDGKAYFDLSLCKRVATLKPNQVAAIGWKMNAFYQDVKPFFV
jgi:Holliday junction resolvase-like predicted endonuclease